MGRLEFPLCAIELNRSRGSSPRADWIAKALTGREQQSSSSQAGANYAMHPVEFWVGGLSARRE